jgi:hypothetical protein
MPREPYADDIPEERPLSDAEVSLVRWMLEHGESHASTFLPQLEEATVRSRCKCGCASVNFAVAGRPPPNGAMNILSDYLWQDAEGYEFGAFVFSLGGVLAGLDLQATMVGLPRTDPKIEIVEAGQVGSLHGLGIVLARARGSN